ncbi:MAG: polysaccharide deacetylase family protein [Armatimonadota bacterium]|nr:polysaccharide deacetylase family protein [Armatimonadota bacterium]
MATVTCALALSAAVPVWPSQASPQPATPAERLRQALLRVEPSERVVRVVVDTNGRIRVAGVVLTYDPRQRDPVPALQTRTWRLAAVAFATLADLTEFHVTAFHHAGGWFDGNRWDVTFTAAVSARELRAAADGSADRVLRSWAHPALRVWPAAQRMAALDVYARSLAPITYESQPTFVGRAVERIVELRDRLISMFRGGPSDGKIFRGAPNRTAIALTFDDGPVPVYTTLLLDTLRSLNVRSTFFLIGTRVLQYPYLARAIADDGHEVANHTHTHPTLTQLPPAVLRTEIAQAQRAITAATGRTPRYFRPPGGQYNTAVVREASRQGLATVLWSDAPGDHTAPAPAELADRITRSARNGGIVLLHQGIPQTIQALPAVASELRRRGFSLLTVTDVVSEEEAS